MEISEKELKKIWNGSTQNELIKFESSRLLMELSHQLAKFEKSVKYRDLREILAALILIPVFSYIAFHTPYILSKIGAATIALYCPIIMYKLRKSQKHRKPADLTVSLSEQLDHSKKYIIEQIKLIDSVLYWYVLPFIPGTVLYFAGLGLNIAMLSSMLIFVFLVNAGILLLNKYVVKKYFLPLLKSIDTAIEDLKVINDE